MYIQLEGRTANTIKSYDDKQIIINDTTYQNSIILSTQSIISPWPVHLLDDLTPTTMNEMIQFNPEIIIIGHSEPGAQLPIKTQQWLSQQRIGVECMLIGAACRTFNVLLSEGRAIVAGFVLR